MSNNMEPLRHELLCFVHAFTQKKLCDYGLNKEVADEIGCALADGLASEWGGQLINFPKDSAYLIALRDLQIYDEFNGRNHSALARKYQLTVRAIYDIIKRVRRRGDPNQPSLL